ncbi:hypothetical protein [Paenibacillus sp. YPG26]|uniref:hypothetical protein n=1 Tax=Paenibacillus sp. YPG26 TaxID=2878915 RepID=UPI0020409D36|nr:hypothetical protein [Paenibacillus sp. YPG26]USB34744.1 hypothetical protein LDO05_08330 [Paenibacillus sp. YPG26]
MNSSSFIGGLILGAAGAVWLSKRQSHLLSSAGSLNLSGLTNKKHECSSTGSAASSFGSHAGQVTPSSAPASSANSKESNLNTIKSIIKGNPGLHREVEQILKETGTVIPGL